MGPILSATKDKPGKTVEEFICPNSRRASAGTSSFLESSCGYPRKIGQAGTKQGSQRSPTGADNRGEDIDTVLAEIEGVFRSLDQEPKTSSIRSITPNELAIPGGGVRRGETSGRTSVSSPGPGSPSPQRLMAELAEVNRGHTKVLSERNLHFVAAGTSLIAQQATQSNSRSVRSDHGHGHTTPNPPRSRPRPSQVLFFQQQLHGQQEDFQRRPRYSYNQYPATLPRKTPIQDASDELNAKYEPPKIEGFDIRKFKEVNRKSEKLFPSTEAETENHFKDTFKASSTQNSSYTKDELDLLASIEKEL